MAHGRSAVTVLALALVAGCGNLVGEIPPPAGVTGIRLATDGTLELVSYVCAPSVDTVSVVSDREGLDDEEPNPVQATWTRTDPVEGLVAFRPDAPGPGWRPAQGTVLDDRGGYLIDLWGGDRSTRSLWLAPGWRTRLRPGVILVSDGSADDAGLEAATPAELATEARQGCRGDG
jgi:hypothetical protein